MKKKFMCMLMAAAMTLSMAACGSKGDDANTDAMLAAHPTVSRPLRSAPPAR